MSWCALLTRKFFEKNIFSLRWLSFGAHKSKKFQKKPIATSQKIAIFFSHFRALCQKKNANHYQNEITSHFSSTFSICLVTMGLRIRILISSWPPTAFRPSIRANVSWRTHWDSKGWSLTCTEPRQVSLRRNPTLFHTSTLADCLLNTLWHVLSLIFRGTLTEWLYSVMLALVSLTTTLLSLKGVSLG